MTILATAPAASASPATEPGRAPSAGPRAQPSVQPTSPATEGTATGSTPGRYVSASAGASFDLPDGWAAEEFTVGSGDAPGTRVIVFDEARMQVAELYHGAGGGVGGACGPGPHPMTELDTAPALDNPWATASGVRFSYRALDMRADGGAFDHQIGLVDNASGQLPDVLVSSPKRPKGRCPSQTGQPRVRRTMTPSSTRWPKPGTTC